MGSFVFKWEHPADEVFVTGTFDDWSKSEKLIKKGDIFVKDVQLKNAEEKIYYKFVVDGNWVTDHTAPQENDASGNLNNVLTIERINKHTPATAGIMSGVTPTSTTAALAKDVPLEKETAKETAPLEQNGSSGLPGTFPETPAAIETGDFSVNPLPAAEGAVNPIKLAPGEKVPDPASFTTNSITSGVHDDPELVAADKAKSEAEPTFGVTPLPAFAGGVNPVKVAPGEKIPESNTLTGNTIDSAVRLDKESYENSGALGHAPVLPPVVTPQAERELNGTGVLDLPPVSKNLIPESSLPMGGEGAGTFDASPTIQSVGPQSTTSALAAKVPLESSKVPEVVKESQEEAGFSPEASAIPSEVSEKSAVEKELKREVPVAPTTSEGIAGEGTIKTEKGVTAAEAAAAVGGAALALGGAAVAAASTIPSKLPESLTTQLPETVAKLPESVANNLPASVTSKLPESVQQSINSINAQPIDHSTAKDTPEIVKESIAESGQSPEAAANEEAVLDKKAVERELLSEIKPETSTGEPAPKVESAKPVESVKPVTSAKPVESVKPVTAVKPVDPTIKTVAPEVPAPATAISAPIENKSAISREVSPHTTTENQTAPIVTSGIDSTSTAEKSAAEPSTTNQTAPTVTTGVDSAPTTETSTAAPIAPVTSAKENAPVTPAKSTTTTNDTPSSSKVGESPGSAAAADKKKKRVSIFGKLKAKFSHNKE